MLYAVVGKAVTTEIYRVGIQYDLVRTCRNEESVVRERTCRREVEHEDEVAAHERQNLVAIVVPYLLNRSIVEILLALDDT